MFFYITCYATQESDSCARLGVLQDKVRSCRQNSFSCQTIYDAPIFYMQFKLKDARILKKMAVQYEVPIGHKIPYNLHQQYRAHHYCCYCFTFHLLQTVRYCQYHQGHTDFMLNSAYVFMNPTPRSCPSKTSKAVCSNQPFP